MCDGAGILPSQSLNSGIKSLHLESKDQLCLKNSFKHKRSLEAIIIEIALAGCAIWNLGEEYLNP